MSKYIFVLRGQKLLWCILLQWSVRCKRSWPLTLQHWRAVLFSEVQPECKEVQCTVYFGKCTLAKCLLLQELLSAKVHSVHSVKCTVPSSLPKCAIDHNDPSKPSHRLTNGPEPSKTMESDGSKIKKPLKNH